MNKNTVNCLYITISLSVRSKCLRILRSIIFQQIFCLFNHVDYICTDTVRCTMSSKFDNRSFKVILRKHKIFFSTRGNWEFYGFLVD